MEWYLENARFRMMVRDIGAELTLLWDKHRQRNWIWQPQPGVWNNSATQLFPVVGQLIHGGLWQDERFFPLSAHGFYASKRFVAWHMMLHTCGLRLAITMTRERYGLSNGVFNLTGH
ncbi:putative galactose mutarotase [Salmonella enterica subsp. arizonae]|nr:putative galactose mutarotase [Salmonella enterica subsp. arizonae]